MEMSITFTGKVEEIKQAMQEFGGEGTPKATPTPAKPKKTKKTEPEITYHDVRKVIDKLPNGKENAKLKQIVIQEFGAPSVQQVDEKYFGAVIKRAEELLAIKEEEDVTSEAPEENTDSARVVTKEELTNKGKAVMDAGKRKELKEVLNQFGVNRLTALEEKDYVAVIEALEAL